MPASSEDENGWQHARNMECRKLIELAVNHSVLSSAPLDEFTIPRRRLQVVVSYVVQYSSPIFQELTQDPRLEILVAYCSTQGAKARIDGGGSELK